MYNAGFRQNVIFLDECKSTNLHAQQLIKTHPECHGTVIQTNYQSVGKGQQSNLWLSKKGDNILTSLILQPGFLDIKKNFYISMIASLAITEAVYKYCNKVKIKWPNDIYCQRKKLAGILIENSIMGSKIRHSVVGMGININQSDFPNNIPNPTSVKLIIGKEVIKENVLNDILVSLEKYYRLLEQQEFQKIKKEYMNLLIGTSDKLKYKDEFESFEGIIVDVEEDGRVIIKDTHNHLRPYYFKEVELIG